MNEVEYRERLIKASQRRARLIAEGKLRSDPKLPTAIITKEL